MRLPYEAPFGNLLVKTTLSAFAKSYIVRFGIPSLTDVQKKRLMELDRGPALDGYVMELYGIVDRIET